MWRWTVPSHLWQLTPARLGVPISASDSAIPPRTGFFALRRWIPTLAGFVALAAVAALYHADWPVYKAAMHQIGVTVFYYPFLDFEAMLGGAQCWQHGIDVYHYNPCDVLGRGHSYSPLWLRIPFLPGIAWETTIGWGFAIGFYLSLGLLGPARNRWALALMIAAAVSPPVAFALERANVDALMFILMAAGGGLLLFGPGIRVGGYAILLLAALLKFYPAVTLILAFRERPRLFAPVIATAGTIFGAFLIYFWREILLLPMNIPSGSYFSDFIFAANLPNGAAFAFRWEHWPLAEPVAIAIWVLLAAITLATIFQMATWPRLAADFAALSLAERIFLLLGGVAMAGCFFSGPNIGYRSIHLIFAIPGMTALAIVGRDKSVRWFALANSIILGVLIWDGALTWRSHIPRTDLGLSVAAVEWVVRELMWWWLVSVFLGLIVVFVIESNVVAGIRFRRRQVSSVEMPIHAERSGR